MSQNDQKWPELTKNESNHWHCLLKIWCSWSQTAWFQKLDSWTLCSLQPWSNRKSKCSIRPTLSTHLLVFLYWLIKNNFFFVLYPMTLNLAFCFFLTIVDSKTVLTRGLRGVTLEKTQPRFCVPAGAKVSFIRKISKNPHNFKDLPHFWQFPAEAREAKEAVLYAPGCDWFDTCRADSPNSDTFSFTSEPCNKNFGNQ